MAPVVQDAKKQALTRKATPMMFIRPPGTGKTYLAKKPGTLVNLTVQIINLLQQ